MRAKEAKPSHPAHTAGHSTLRTVRLGRTGSRAPAPREGVLKIIGKIVAAVLKKILAELRIHPRQIRHALNIVRPHAESNVGEALRLRAVRSSADFATENLSNALMFESPDELRQHTVGLLASSLSPPPPAGPQLKVLEFGVWQGNTVRLWAAAIGPSFTVAGFDSFQGLSEHWTGTNMGKGSFSLGGRLPAVPDNVELVEGWVDETLPRFLGSHDCSSVSLVHIDFDTYSPSFVALSLIGPILQPGTLILFDDFFGYPNWQSHEYKALIDSGISFDYLAFSGGGQGGHPQNCLIEVIQK